MKNTKRIFIIPGYRQSLTSAQYRNLGKTFRKNGFKVKFISPCWNKKNFTENTNDFLKIYKKEKLRKKYILGFSYGAVIAFIATQKISCEGLILCSLSPVNQTNFINKTKAKKILILYGQQEAGTLIKKVLKTFQEIKTKNKHLIEVENTQHYIGDKRYLQTISTITQTIL